MVYRTRCPEDARRILIMTDEQIEQKLGLIISEMETIRTARAGYLRSLLDARRRVAVAVASGDKRKLKHPDVLNAIDEIPANKRTIEMVNNLVELEIGEIAFQDAVNVETLKLLGNEIDGLKNLIVHVSSQRKAEKF